MAVRLHVTFELTQKREAEWLAFWKFCSHPHARQHLSYAAVELGKGRTPLFIAGYVDDARSLKQSVVVLPVLPHLSTRDLDFIALSLTGQGAVRRG